MDVPYLLGGLLFFIAPPVISVIIRKVRKKPSLKNPVWQYVISFVVVSVMLISGEHDYFGIIFIIGLIVYSACFYLEYSPIRQRKAYSQPIVNNELEDLDFNDKDAVMRFAQMHPQSINEINQLLELHKRLNK